MNNISNNYLIGTAAVAVIALIGYFSFSMNNNESDLATTKGEVLEIVVTGDNTEDNTPSEEKSHETVNAVEVSEANSVAE